MECFEECVVFIIFKIDLSGAMTIKAPTHSNGIYLAYNILLFYITVTFGAIQFSNLHVLGMTKKYMVGKVMDFDPLYWRKTIERLPDFIDLKFSGTCAFHNYRMTIHTNINRRDTGAFTSFG
jgi:hypothetical protein